MNLNYAAQNAGVLIWSGASGVPVDIRHHIGFAFTFEVVSVDLVADAVFNIQSAPPSAGDPCVPGTFVPVPEVPTCISDFGATPGPQAQIVIPGGTKVGSICTAALPCKPDAFVQLVSATGPTANVRVVATLHGPR